jgi:hypothetical protein
VAAGHGRVVAVAVAVVGNVEHCFECRGGDGRGADRRGGDTRAARWRAGGQRAERSPARLRAGLLEPVSGTGGVAGREAGPGRAGGGLCSRIRQ